MQAFARVVEAGSFTKAAETLHMSKTTVCVPERVKDRDFMMEQLLMTQQ